MSTNETLDELKLDMAKAMVDNEVKENIEIFEALIHMPQISKFARIKMLAICLAKEIYHLEQLSHEGKLNLAQQTNDYIVKLLNDVKDIPHE